MLENSDKTLINATLSGDIESFGELCGRYYNAMAAVAYGVLGDHHLSQDAAQEAFARALKNLKKLKSKDKFGSWLGRICRNVAVDMAKTRSRDIEVDDIEAIADSKVEKSEDESVREAIGKLSSADRDVIVLRYYNSMTHEQMGQVLGLSRAAINNRLVRAKVKLAKYLQSDGFAGVEL